ncbi:MAG: neutral/alkaline non-lysosomal ceramidase N-terminal domain-containing protein [Pirellulaceae bacterium]
MASLWLALIAGNVFAANTTWRAGVAVEKITPPFPMWMAGYGNRTAPSQGVAHDLWAKALAVEDSGGRRAVLVTLDLVGIDRATSVAICSTIARRHHLERDQIALNCSHNHCGPVVGSNLHAMYFLDAAEQARVEQYTAWLSERIVRGVGQALERLAPAELARGEGQATIAVNRRSNPHDSVLARRELGILRGPVDHRVPVLRVTDIEGRIVAIVFGYACHPTKLTDFHRFCGDYVGFSQLSVEQAHPGAVAMFWQGCGGDQTPWPRGGGDLQATEAVGRELAGSVERALAAPLVPIRGPLATAYGEIDLPLADIPGASELESLARGQNRFKARLARQLLDTLAAGGEPARSYANYPVQVWGLGSELVWIALGGETVVDYTIRLQDECAAHAAGSSTSTVWVAGYTNDVMAYVPSRRVLEEGGYEGGEAMVYYGLPARWAPDVEERIVAEVRRQVAGVRKQIDASADPPGESGKGGQR